jgi:hypothetical protein
MAVAAGGSVRLRDIFGKSFRLYGRHFVDFSFLAAIAISPFYVMVLATGPTGLASPAWAVMGISMILVSPLLANGAITYGVVQDLHGRPADMLETLGALAPRLLPMISVAISLTLLVALGALLAAILLTAVRGVLPMSDAALGGWMLLPPTAVVLCIFFVAAPMCVAERAGFVKSLWRSRLLTKGHRWQIFGTLIVILVPDIVVSAAARMVALSMRGYTGRLIADNVVQIAVSWIVETIFIAFLSVVTAVFYYKLRAAKDGVVHAKVADVFE